MYNTLKLRAMTDIYKELIEALEGFTNGMRRYWKDTCQEETPDLSRVIEAEKLIEKARAEEYYSKELAALPISDVSGWVSVSDKLPKEYKHRMSRDVLTIAGSKMIVNSYDFELGRWNGSPHITTTHWMELPSPPCR